MYRVFADSFIKRDALHSGMPVWLQTDMEGQNVTETSTA